MRGMKVFVSSRSFGAQCEEAIDIIKQVADVVKALKGEKPDLVANPEVLEKLGIK